MFSVLIALTVLLVLGTALLIAVKLEKPPTLHTGPPPEEPPQEEPSNSRAILILTTVRIRGTSEHSPLVELTPGMVYVRGDNERWAITERTFLMESAIRSLVRGGSARWVDDVDVIEHLNRLIQSVVARNRPEGSGRILESLEQALLRLSPNYSGPLRPQVSYEQAMGLDPEPQSLDRIDRLLREDDPV